MITYILQCEDCDFGLEVLCSISEHETLIKPGIECLRCSGHMSQAVSCNSNRPAVRQSFSEVGQGNELQLPTPDGVDIKFKDKRHAEDYLSEHGLMSKWIEDDM